MGKVKIAGDLIVLEEIEGDPALRRRLEAMSAVETVDLLVGGSRGYWEPVILSRNGRAVAAIRPVEGMPGTLSGQTVEIGLPPRDDGLATFGMRLQYWDTRDNRIR